MAPKTQKEFCSRRPYVLLSVNMLVRFFSVKCNSDQPKGSHVFAGRLENPVETDDYIKAYLFDSLEISPNGER